MSVYDLFAQSLCDIILYLLHVHIVHILEFFIIYITNWFVCIYFRQFAMSGQTTPELLSDVNFALELSLNLHIIQALASQQNVCVYVCVCARKNTIEYTPPVAICFHYLTFSKIEKDQSI